MCFWRLWHQLHRRCPSRCDGLHRCVSPVSLVVFQVERRMKAENEEHVHFKSLGVSPWKAKRFCDKKIQVKSRQDSLVWFFCLRPTFRAALRTRESCKWQMRARPFKRCFTLTQQCIDVYLEEYKSSWCLIWQYISYDAYYRIFQFHKTDKTSCTASGKPLGTRCCHNVAGAGRFLKHKSLALPAFAEHGWWIL